jgi:xanthine dehydrogenase accessory factor
MDLNDGTADWSLSGPAVLRRMAEALDAGTPAAVATVVAVEGNAYRRPGAKMLLTGDGTAGSVTAGCLESEVEDIAAAVRKSGQSRVERFDLTDDEQWGLGLGCNGVIDLLVEPLDDRFVPLLDGYRAGGDGLAVTVIGSDTPEVSVGERGYAPGGELAAVGNVPDWLCDAVGQRGREALDHGRARTVTVSAPGGGDCRVFLDPVLTPPSLYIFGSGIDVRPVTELATRAGFSVTVVPFRGGRATEEAFPRADRVVSASAPRLDESLTFDTDTYAVVMSHNAVDDRLALEALLETPVPYIGLMGPEDRFREIVDALGSEGRTLTDAELERVYTPIGLDLGGGEPYQIAVSIVSEVLAVHNGRAPGHLRDRGAPIHDRSGPTEE